MKPKNVFKKSIAEIDSAMEKLNQAKGYLLIASINQDDLEEAYDNIKYATQQLNELLTNLERVI